MEDMCKICINRGLMKNNGFMESRYGGVFRNHLDRTLCVFPAPPVRWEY